MLAYMQGPEEPGWYKVVHRSGKPINKSIHSYGYSFALFAMAHAYGVTQDSRYLAQAIATWKSDVWPGLSAAREWNRNRKLLGNPSGKTWSQNPFMHLFEALLALYEVTRSEEVWLDIQAMARFLDEKLLQPCGCLPEWYVAASFSPLDGDDTRLYLGHQVEWAFLLSHAVELGLNRDYLDTANSLLDLALSHGISADTGGLQATSTMDGKEGDKSYWWWAQAELMRATAHFAEMHGRSDLYPVFEQTQSFARMHFIDLARNNWTNKSPYFADDQGKIRQVIGYHWMAYYAEALRLSRQ
jgi:mannose/cellobiose epimerase-like protein (N-acyl-D-glucosamine 2-epimerase family)